MTKRPWWLWLASASFISYFILLYSSLYYLREPVGYIAAPSDHGILIRSVVPGSHAEHAGMRAGDRIVRAFGLPLDDFLDDLAMGANVPVDEPSEWTVERDGTPVTLTVEPMHRRWVAQAGPYLITVLGLLTSLLLALLLAWRGDGRPTTLLGAWLLGSMACASLPLWPRSMAFELRALPLPVALLIWPAAISSVFVPALMFAFCAIFPRPLLTPRRLTLALLPILLTAGFVAVTSVLIVHAPVMATQIPLPPLIQVIGPLSYALYFAAAAVLLFVSLRRSTDRNDRRRAQILFVGIAAGALGLLAIAGFFIPSIQASPAVSSAGTVAFAFLPIAFAYATLRHRLFDLRIIVRQGLQYALARGAVLGLIPLMAAVLVADAMLHSDQTLRSILAARGWTYAMITMSAAVVYYKRNEWMAAIDRRFFRDRYAAQQILKDVVQDAGASPDLDTAAKKVIGRVDSALHPVMAAVMTKPRASTAFSAVASVGDAIATVPANSPLAQVARALGKPVTASALGLTAGVELIVPIAVDPNHDEAMLVLGPRKSEEPYSKEDQELLAAVAASLRLLMGRAAPSADMPTMTSASPARLLGNRYRIERPIGEGGMGMVYAATDETLQRRVAIKVIRDQHLTGDALARFQREARTAASLSHPHIVTVHDFGTDETGSPYLVMELLEGESLRHAIKGGRMPVERAITILTGLASALDAAHAKGVIHRDLKPENVFLAGHTHAKILDYGIAKAMESSTTFATPGVMGTLAYMAPEQAGGGVASPAWDVWALAVIAFEMITAQHPFNGGLPVVSATPVRSIVPDVDPTLATAIDRALALSPSNRPATASLFLESVR